MKNRMNLSLSSNHPWCKIASVSRNLFYSILSPIQQGRPLPSLMYKSCFYAYSLFFTDFHLWIQVLCAQRCILIDGSLLVEQYGGQQSGPDQRVCGHCPLTPGQDRQWTRCLQTGKIITIETPDSTDWDQSCGSAFIFFGFGTSCSSQWGSGYSCFYCRDHWQDPVMLLLTG